MSKPKGYEVCPKCGGYGVQFGYSWNDQYDCYFCCKTGWVTEAQARSYYGEFDHNVSGIQEVPDGTDGGDANKDQDG